MIPTVLILDLHGEEATHRHLRFALQGGDIPTVIYGIAWKIPTLIHDGVIWEEGLMEKLKLSYLMSRLEIRACSSCA